MAVRRTHTDTPLTCPVSLRPPWKGGFTVTSELLDQLPALEREADELERRAAAIRQIIDGVRALNGDSDAVISAALLSLIAQASRSRRAPQTGLAGRKPSSA